jgi:hypothetical protein
MIVVGFLVREMAINWFLTFGLLLRRLIGGCGMSVRSVSR